MNTEKILNNIIRINFNIKDEFFSKTQFEDSILEEKFQENLHITMIRNNFVSNMVVFLGYLATFIYILIAFFKIIYVVICCVCFLLAVISLLISTKYKSRKAVFINNHIQIFLSSLNLISKGFVLCLHFNTDKNDNVEELLRIIIYEFVSTNLFLITRLEANIFISLFYFLLNLSIVILGYAYSFENRYYLLEGFTSFCTFLIFYSIRKQWDYKIRIIFAEKIKFEKYFIYTVDYLEGLNGYNINVQNNKMIFYGKKINTLISDLIENNFLIDWDKDQARDLDKEKKFKDSDISNKIIKHKLDLQKKSQVQDKFFFDEYELNSKDENLTISLLKKLTFYKNYENQNSFTDKINLAEVKVDPNSNFN